MAKPEERGMSIGLQHFADDGSAEADTPAAGNAEDSLMNAFAGGKPEEKPEEGEKPQGEAGKKEVKLAAWTEQLEPDLRTNAETAAKLAKFGKVSDMAKAFLELEKNAASAGIPGKEASVQEVEQFWEKAGKPKTADGYSFAKNRELEGAAFAAAAHKANLTSAQADAMFKNLNEAGEARLKAAQSAAQSAMESQARETARALKDEYGSKYQEKMELLSRGLMAAGPNVASILRKAGLAGEPEIVRAFISYGEFTAESGAARGKGAGDPMKGILSGGSFDYKD